MPLRQESKVAVPELLMLNQLRQIPFRSDNKGPHWHVESEADREFASIGAAVLLENDLVVLF